MSLAQRTRRGGAQTAEVDSVNNDLTPAHLRLIDALAARDVADYLREQAAQRNAATQTRPNPAPLQPATKAA